jgi:hypothetical protein
MLQEETVAAWLTELKQQSVVCGQGQPARYSQEALSSSTKMNIDFF